MLKTTLDVAQKRHVHVQKTPFSTKNKKIGGGNFKKIGSKGFSGGASAGLSGQALGLSLHDSTSIALKIGSSKLVKVS